MVSAAGSRYARHGWRALLCGAAAVLLLTMTGLVQAQTKEALQSFDIPAGTLIDALDRFGEQSGLQVTYDATLLQGKTAPAVAGKLSANAALARLLHGTGLASGYANARTVVIKKADAVPKRGVMPNSQGSVAPSSDEEKVVAMPAIMVQGTRTLNMDIARTEDDPQPYVVFDRGQIERSGASSLGQFLQQRLTMNASTTNTGADNPSTSKINLRGLGVNQTLVLIDGHRVAGPGFSAAGAGALGQADITGIPLAAIDRIEILPTTASGIYGGSATGGVVNIVMRRDYSGVEARLTYGNTFDTDTATRKIDLTGGFNFNDGRTNLLVTGSYSDANDLLVGDRNMEERGRSLIRRNNQAFFLPPNYPPLGATPNISSSDGSDLILKDGTSLNSSFTSVPVGYAGPGSDGGAALVANAGNYNWELANSALTGGGRKSAIYTQPEVASGSMTLRHQFNDGFKVFAELDASNSTNNYPVSVLASNYLIPATAPTNPFAQSIRVTVPLTGAYSTRSTTSKQRRALVGFIKQLPGNWQLGLDYTWDRSTVTFGTGLGTTAGLRTQIASGALDVLRDTSAFPPDITPFVVKSQFTSPFQTTLKDVSARLSGPLGHLPAGEPTLSALLEHRSQGIPQSLFMCLSCGDAYVYPGRSQVVRSAYLELRVPLVSNKNARPGLHELDLQIAVRQDEYSSTTGNTLTVSLPLPSPMPTTTRSRNELRSVDPTIALRWKPFEDLALRASYGTGFLPPGLHQLASVVELLPTSYGVDPRRGNSTAGPYTYVYGGSPGLKPEQSKSWSAGLVLTPRIMPSLRLSVDYTRIEKTDNIAYYPGGTQGIINDEALFPWRVIRGANLPGDLPGWAGPIIYLDNTNLNLARAELEAWDAQLDFTVNTARFGTLNTYLLGTWQPHYKTQILSSEPVVENIGVSSNNPPKFKSNAGITWSYGSWQAGWNSRYIASYLAFPPSYPTLYLANQGGNGKVSSQIYHDAFVSYDFGYEGATSGVYGWLSGAKVQLGIRNLFNTRPPFDAGNMTGSAFSKFGDPRLSSYYLTLKHSF